MRGDPTGRRQARAGGVRRGADGGRGAPSRGGPGVHDHRARPAEAAQPPGGRGTRSSRTGRGCRTGDDRRAGRRPARRPDQGPVAARRERRRHPQARPPRSAPRRRDGRERRHDGVGDGAARRTRGVARVRHGRARRGAPAVDAGAGRVGRPGTARPHEDRGGVRGREVDPGRRGDAGAPGDAGRRRGGVRDRPLPGLLPRRLRASGGLDAAHARRGRRGDTGPGRARRPRLGAHRGQSGAARRTARSRAPRARARRGADGVRGAGHHRAGDHAVPAGRVGATHRGASLEANLAAVRGNVRLAGRVATAWAGR